MVLGRLRQRGRNQNRRIVLFALILIIVAGLRWLSGQFEVPFLALVVLERIVFAAVVFFVASVIARFTTKPVESLIADADIEARLLLSKTYSAIIYLVAFVIILVGLGVNAGNITIFLGFLATGFAFSIRDVISAYLAWFILLTKKPFRIGETISIDGTLGRVQHIGTFFVLLDDTPATRSDYTRIPNTLFLQKPIRNYGHDRIRSRFEVHVQAMPASFEKNATKVEDELADLDARVTIDSVERSLVVACDYAFSLEERETAQRRVAAAIVTAFGVKQA